MFSNTTLSFCLWLLFTFYLPLPLICLRITFEKYNNIDSKTKALLGHLFYQRRWDISSEFEWTVSKVANDNYSW